jgi:hypothetical protein
MFIAHLPVGYVATLALLNRVEVAAAVRRRLLALGLAASVLPDLDLLYFYLVDQRRQVHHAYLPHLPLFWVGVLALTAGALSLASRPRVAWVALGVFTTNVLLHLVLDSTAGGIRWLWPWSAAEFRLVEVPARYRPWYLNFVLHWSFLLEIALMLVAVWVYVRRRPDRASVR